MNCEYILVVILVAVRERHPYIILITQPTMVSVQMTERGAVRGRVRMASSTLYSLLNSSQRQPSNTER